MLNESSDMPFKKYLARKCRAWFRGWGRDEPAAAPTASKPSSGGAGSATPATPARLAAPTMSDEDEDAELTGGQDET
jgi:hypothetical protein